MISLDSDRWLRLTSSVGGDGTLAAQLLRHIYMAAKSTTRNYNIKPVTNSSSVVVTLRMLWHRI